MTNTQITHVQMFMNLKPWHQAIISSVKKDLKNEHLKLDRGFFKANFGSKVLQRLNIDDLLAVYPKVIEQGHEKLAEFIVNRWLLRHLKLYTHFEARLKAVHVKIDEIHEIDDQVACELIATACAAFGAINTYIFCIFNGVNFSKNSLEQLFNKAQEDAQQHAQSGRTLAAT